ncbi:MAG: 23S rRNA (adenine(2503)-C(2))-methyltransferase RlmN [Bacteroidales bacterium]|nr:23S rRNA (adenine(2503)-C(2))-methyltransferase RlmN [Bacteroidales bacterium]
MKRDLFGLTLSELQALCAEQGFPKFAAKQLCDWMYKKGVTTFDEMTNLSLAMRGWLNGHCLLGRTFPVQTQTSVDGTKKYLFDCHNEADVNNRGEHHFVESVFIPSGERATLCISCQKGCKMGCRFCVTGQQGFHGHLSASQILNQIFSVPESETLTNVVFMGMGEPLDNYDAVYSALEVLTAPWGLAWSPHRITVSTVGITPVLARLLEESDCHIAISLHNAYPTERADIMPMEKAYPVAATLAMLKRYNWYGQRRISMEYILFKGLNDDLTHAAELVRILQGLHCRVNLIRFHASPGTPFRAPSDETIATFQEYLKRHDINCTLRASRGEDIMAACGLLAGTQAPPA